jgi:hypothetical protein
MTYYSYSNLLYRYACKAMEAMPYIPRRSVYRGLAYKLIAEEITAAEWMRLKARLDRFVQDNSNL